MDERRRGGGPGPAGARAAAGLLPRGPGVYRFRNRHGLVLYLGRAVDLRRRVVSYWGDLGDRRHLSAMVEQIHRVEAVGCDSPHEAAWLERNLLERTLPSWNRSLGGQEVPVHVCLWGSGADWRVTVTHAPVTADGAVCFGPYLGGTRVRTAVRALRRVFSQPNLANGRGQGATGPLAVLSRDRAAVAALRADLVRRREGAAERLAYEAAARLQAELDAVDWLAAEQKVTVPDPVDSDVCGWAGGVLVRLGIRDGRMCEWDQRPCTRPTAARLLTATPRADRRPRLHR